MQTKNEETDRKLVLRKQSGKSTFEKSRAKNRVKIRRIENLRKFRKKFFFSISITCLFKKNTYPPMSTFRKGGPKYLLYLLLRKVE